MPSPDRRSDQHTDRLSLVAGGPFHSALDRLGLLGDDQLPSGRATIVLSGVAWLPLAVLAVAQSFTDSSDSGWAFFSDPTVYARYLVAIWVMVGTERYAEGRIALIARQFREAGLLSDAAQAGFSAAVDQADRRSSSRLAEAILLVLALTSSIATTRYVVAISGSSWEGQLVGDVVVLSWAGVATSFVANPLFLFLVLRWLWRFGVWAMLLHRISRLPLLFTPPHPDRSAGLGFLSIYPSIFTGFVFALGCVIASSFLKELDSVQHTQQQMWIAIGGWLAAILVTFLGPLLVFVAPLYRVREQALLEYGRLATQHHLEFHRKWISEEGRGEGIVGSPDPSSAADLNAAVQAVWDMRFAPIDRIAIVNLVLAAGLPMLAVVVRQIPIGDLLGWIVGAIL